MRQALVIENPEWKPFAEVSAKFKALAGAAVIVVRGRVKENKTSANTQKPAIRKAEPETTEALAADLKKQGADAEEIKKAVAKFERKLSKAAATVALFLLCCCSAFAQQNILGHLPTTTMAVQSTNNTGSGTIGWNLGDVLVFQAVLQSTNNIHVSTKSNIFLYLDANMAGNTWATNQYTVSFPTHTYQTNAVASFATITNTIGATFLRIGQQCNPNTNIVTFVGLDVLKTRP